MLSPKTIKKLQDAQAKLDEFIRKKNNLADSNTQKSFVRTKIALLVEIGELANELETFKHWKKNKKSVAEKGPTELAKACEELIDCLHFYLSWANSFEIDFANYKFNKLVPEPDENELLLALFSETEAFNTTLPLSILKPKMLDSFEKNFSENTKEIEKKRFSKKDLKIIQETKEKIKKDLEKIGNNFLTELQEEKNKQVFHRWLIIFEELAYKLGMRSEKDIYNAYIAKNKINWKRQKKNY